MPDQDVRLQHLKVWLDEQLAILFADQGWGAVPPATLTAASSDASFRRYFRWEGEGRSFVVMDAPPPQENCKPFVDIAFLLAKSGINVPKIYAEDLERGFLLLNDLGNETYLDVIDGENADVLFSDALKALLAFQQLPMVAPLPSYDVALLRRELELFPEWYVKRELGIEFDAAQQQQWQAVSDLLIDSDLAQPKVLVHRDYMPRNLMLSEPNPGVLDFQDAVYGPVTYDVTCLFKDALQALLAFQQLPMVAPLPSYDVALLRRELELFPEWYVKRELGIELDAAQQVLWQQVSDLLIDSALAQPKVLVHRDYMPRNLMISEPNPGVLDFQDAVYGPVTYDVTCLFKDAFLSWPEERVRGWLDSYWQQASALNIPVQPDFEDFLRASDLMGVQRHLKVIGIFARICHRDGKPRYLADVPRFFAYIDAVIARRPELAELDVLLASLRAGVKA